MDSQILKKGQELLKLKNQYEDFINKDGILSLWCVSSLIIGKSYSIFVDDDEFLSIVKKLAKERLENINKQIENL